MAFLLEHPYTYLKCNKQYQNEKFTPLNEMTSIRVYVGDTGVLESPSTLTSMVFLTAEIKFSLPLYCIFLTKTLSQERRKHAKKTTIPLIRLTHNFQKPPVSRKKFLPLQYQPNIFNLHFSILQNRRWNFFSYP